MTSIPRESLELVPFTVTATGTDGQPVPLDTLEVTVVLARSRPDSGWAAPTVIDDGLFVLVGPPDQALAPGTYRIWGRLTDTPEVPVFEIGTLTIS